MMEEPEICCLPNEILCKIVSHLNTKSFLSLNQCCKFFNMNLWKLIKHLKINQKMLYKFTQFNFLYNLESLELFGCYIDSTHTLKFQKLDRIRLLTISYSDINFSILQYLTSLNSLYISNSHIDPRNFHYITHLHNLKNLSLIDSKIDDSIFDIILSLPSLNILNIENCSYSICNNKFMKLSNLSKLKRFTFKKCHRENDIPTSIDLGILSHHPNLKSIKLIGNYDITWKQSIKNLRVLSVHVNYLLREGINDTKLMSLASLEINSDSQIEYLPLYISSDVSSLKLNHFSIKNSEFSNIKTLVLNGCEVKDSSLKFLRHMDKLESLDLNIIGDLINDETIFNIQSLNIKRIKIHGSNITDRCIEYISRNFIQLEHLQISRSLLSDNSINYMTNLKCLQYLSLSGNQNITHKGINLLKNCKNLVELDLSYLNIYDRDVIIPILNLTSIKRIDLSFNMLDDDDILYMILNHKIEVIFIPDHDVYNNNGV